MNIIIIKGKQNSGKTTTAACVHNELINPEGALLKLFRTAGGYMPVIGEMRDFWSVLDLGRKRIVIISQGDDANYLEKMMEHLIWSYAPDIVVVCTRTRSVDGSSWNMLHEKYNSSLRDDCIFEVTLTPNPADALNAKKTLARTIVNKIKTL